MALSQTDLDTLVGAYARGQLSVTYDGRAVTFDNREGLRERIRDVAAALGVADPLLGATRTAARTSMLSYNRG